MCPKTNAVISTGSSDKIKNDVFVRVVARNRLGGFNAIG